jgi:hypothetical protein
MKKKCTNCKKNLFISDFSPNSNSNLGFTSHCKVCRAKKEADRRKNPQYKEKIKKYKLDPANKRRTKDSALKRLFGISIEEYDKMFQKQNGVCAICYRKEVASHIRSLAVDHCHKTGKVRGLLCTSCNQGIGHLKDSVVLLENAIRYLTEK